MSNEEHAVPEEQIEFSFLSDSPVMSDELGGHEHLAEIIAEGVESDAKGMTVGLEGTWGSGKSSVLAMAEEQWAKNDDIRVFMFDIWAHEGDSLRRSFLEELIGCLQKKEAAAGGQVSDAWLKKRSRDCDKWPSECADCETAVEECRPDIIRDNLRRRTERNDIRTEPHISWWGMCFALAALLLPISTSLLSSGDLEGGPRVFWLVVITSPLIIIVLFLVSGWGRRKKGEGLLHLGEFIGKTKEVTKHTTHRGIEPTSIEFQEYYLQLLKLALDDHPARKLVIILDNLDRVERDTALKAWATMRTFLRPGTSGSRDCRDRVWLFLPYDPDAFDHLWKHEQADSAGGRNGSASDHADLARAFREKTFQVRYRVAPPLTSRWQGYFKSRLAEAVKGASEKIRHNVYQVFRVQVVREFGRGIPTPREMKMFINRVVAIAQQHRDIRLPEAALYAALELAGIDAAIEELAMGKLKVPGAVADVLADDWPSGLAAIHFGVERSAANEVLFRPRIQRILSAADANDLAKLLDEVGGAEGFEAFVQDESEEGDLAAVLMAAKCLQSQTPATASINVTGAARRLASRLVEVTEGSWILKGTLSEEDARAVVILLAFSPEIAGHVSRCLSPDISEAGDDESIEDLLQEWVPAASVIVEHLSKAEGYTGLSIALPDAETYDSLLGMLAAHPVGCKLISYFRPATHVKADYLEHILVRIRAGNVTQVDHFILSGLIEMPCWEAEGIAAEVGMALTTGIPQGDTKAATVASDFLFERRDVGDDDAFAEALREYGKSAELMVELGEHAGDPGPLALCTALLILYSLEPELSEEEEAEVDCDPRLSHILDSPEPGLVAAMADLSVRHGLVPDLLSAISNAELQDRALVEQLLCEFVQRDEKARVLTSPVFLANHCLLENVLSDMPDGQCYETLTDRLLGTDLLAKLEAAPADSSLMRAYYQAIVADEVDSTGLEGMLQGFLRALDEADWADILRDGSWELDVLLQLCEKGWSPDLNQQFTKALVTHAREMVAGSAKHTDFHDDEFSGLMDCVVQRERKQFRERLIDEVLDNAGASILPILSSYGNELQVAITQVFKVKGRKKARKAVVRESLVRLATSDNSEQLLWVIDVLIANTDKMDLSEDDAKCLRDRLGDTIRELLADLTDEDSDEDAEHLLDEEKRSEIEKLAEKLGVDIIDEPEEPAGPDEPNEPEEDAETA